MCDKLVDEIAHKYFGAVTFDTVKTHTTLKYIKDAMQELLEMERNNQKVNLDSV